MVLFPRFPPKCSDYRPVLPGPDWRHFKQQLNWTHGGKRKHWKLTWPRVGLCSPWQPLPAARGCHNHKRCSNEKTRYSLGSVEYSSYCVEHVFVCLVPIPWFKTILQVLAILWARSYHLGWLSGSCVKSACLASMKPWVQTQCYHKKKKSIEVYYLSFFLCFFFETGPAQAGLERMILLP
jgi:hypothetical protein